MDEGSIGSNETLIPNEESLLNPMDSNVTFNKFSLYVERLGSLQECGRMKGQSQYKVAITGKPRTWYWSLHAPFHDVCSTPTTMSRWYIYIWLYLKRHSRTGSVPEVFKRSIVPCHNKSHFLLRKQHNASPRSEIDFVLWIKYLWFSSISSTSGLVVK